MGTLASLHRQLTREQRFPIGARCTRCGWRHVSALVVAGSNPVMCYQCRAPMTGRPSFEVHHIGGRANGGTGIRVPANLHRLCSDRALDWPPEVASNRGASHALSIAARLLGWSDLLASLADFIDNNPRIRQSAEALALAMMLDDAANDFRQAATKILEEGN